MIADQSLRYRPRGVLRPAAVTLAEPRAPAVVITLTALPRTVHLSLWRGDDFAFRLTVNDTNGEAIDLEGALPRAQIRTIADAPGVEGEFQITVFENALTLHLTAEVSAQLPPRGVWDCQIERGGWTTTLAAGNVQLAPDVTR